MTLIQKTSLLEQSQQPAQEQPIQADEERLKRPEQTNGNVPRSVLKTWLGALKYRVSISWFGGLHVYSCR